MKCRIPNSNGLDVVASLEDNEDVMQGPPNLRTFELLDSWMHDNAGHLIDPQPLSGDQLEALRTTCSPARNGEDEEPQLPDIEEVAALASRLIKRHGQQHDRQKKAAEKSESRSISTVQKSTKATAKDKPSTKAKSSKTSTRRETALAAAQQELDKALKQGKIARLSKLKDKVVYYKCPLTIKHDKGSVSEKVVLAAEAALHDKEGNFLDRELNSRELTAILQDHGGSTSARALRSLSNWIESHRKTHYGEDAKKKKKEGDKSKTKKSEVQEEQDADDGDDDDDGDEED
ncbi:hypothetical protein KCU67_g3480, partial [Aureobasidium melanogenum]